MDWSRISIGRSIPDWKKFKLTVGATSPSVFQKEHTYEISLQKTDVYSSIYGTTYSCNHPIYNKYTLFKMHNKGLAVIQQRYDPIYKTTHWTDIDPWLIDDLYLHIKFEDFLMNALASVKMMYTLQ